MLDTGTQLDTERTSPADSLCAAQSLRHELRDFPINANPDPHLTRDLRPGFLLPYLLDFDSLTYGRWEYWFEATELGALPDRPIPPIDWQPPYPRTRKMLETTLNLIPRHGSWQSMGGWEYLRYLLAWMLWGFGHPGYGEPEEPFGCEGASMRVYQALNACALTLWPADYFGDLMAENAYGRGQGFFPTPMEVCIMMADMLMGNTEEDLRAKTVCDPAVGTGRFLLAASNYSMCLFGQDIDPTMCMACLVNGYLFAPWMARPLPFLKGRSDTPDQDSPVSDNAAQSSPDFAQAPGETEHNAGEAFRFEPTRKRRRTNGEGGQGVLF